MNCWKCTQPISEIAKKIPFRALCPHCGIDLHTCTNCKFYSPGKPNDCLVPGTEYVKDREAMNFCEEFQINTTPPQTNNKEKTKNKFNSLFKDE